MKKFFARIVSFLQNLFTNLDAWIHEHVGPAITVVNAIKSAVDSPIADALTAIIPGNADDKAKAWLRAHLGKAISVLQISEAISKEKTLEKKLQLLLEYLQTLSPEMRKGVYLRLSSLIAKSSGGGKEKVRGHSIDLLTQMQYSKLAEKADWSQLPESKYTAQSYLQNNQVFNPATMQYENG